MIKENGIILETDLYTFPPRIDLGEFGKRSNHFPVGIIHSCRDHSFRLYYILIFFAESWNWSLRSRSYANVQGPRLRSVSFLLENLWASAICRYAKVASCAGKNRDCSGFIQHFWSQYITLVTESIDWPFYEAMTRICYQQFTNIIWDTPYFLRGCPCRTNNVNLRYSTISLICLILR